MGANNHWRTGVATSKGHSSRWDTCPTSMIHVFHSCDWWRSFHNSPLRWWPDDHQKTSIPYSWHCWHSIGQCLGWIELLMIVINQLKRVYKEVNFDIGIKHSYLGMNVTVCDNEVRSTWMATSTVIREGNLDHFCSEREKLLFLSTRVVNKSTINDLKESNRCLKYLNKTISWTHPVSKQF
jgi:hypothetical protein